MTKRFALIWAATYIAGMLWIGLSFINPLFFLAGLLLPIAYVTAKLIED